jgi:predicted ArsR family transcriptional regulator
MLLLEHHCPICDAASACQGLCRAELDLFRETLGGDVEVTRAQHVLSGDLRCAYRVSPRAASESSDEQVPADTLVSA